MFVPEKYADKLNAIGNGLIDIAKKDIVTTETLEGIKTEICTILEEINAEYKTQQAKNRLKELAGNKFPQCLLKFCKNIRDYKECTDIDMYSSWDREIKFDGYTLYISYTGNDFKGYNLQLKTNSLTYECDSVFCLWRDFAFAVK